MPLTEVPTSPPGKPPAPFTRRKRVRYEELDPDELLHLIDRLEDERSRALRREGIWISLIAHLILFWFLFYGPKFRSHQPHVVNPNDSKQKDLTFLNLPPDAQKRVQPPKAAPPSDKNRIAQAPKPTIDRKTLQQLEAMKRAGPPVPVPPAPAPQPAQPAPAPQQQAQARPAAPSPPPPPPPQQQSLLNEPRPAPTPNRPGFDTGPQNAGDAIRQAERDAARGGPSGDYGQNAPSQHSALGVGPDILSDTMGVDFGPYMRRVIEATKRSWYPIIPESARPPLDRQGRVGIRFKILPDGSVNEMILEFPSGDVSLDRAAWGGITGASPYPPLPKEFKGPYLELRFGFYYNLDPDKFR